VDYFYQSVGLFLSRCWIIFIQVLDYFYPGVGLFLSRCRIIVVNTMDYYSLAAILFYLVSYFENNTGVQTILLP